MHAVAKVVLPQIADGTLTKLKAVAEDDKKPGESRKAASSKVAVWEAKKAVCADPAPAYDKAYANFTTLLDALDKALDRPAGGEGAPAALISGTDFSVADCAVACMLARAQWAAEPREAAAARPRVAAYWAAVSGREKFGRADVWTSLRPVAALALLGEAAVDGIVATYDTAAGAWGDHVAPPLGKAWHAVSDPINDHVVKPVAASPQFQAASLAIKVGADRTGAFLNEKVLTPCKAGSEQAGAWLGERAEETKVAAGRAMEATKHAADAAAEATKHAAERAAEATKHAAEAAAEHAKHAAEAAKHAADKVKEAASPKAPAEGEADKKEEKKEEKKKEAESPKAAAE